MNVLQRGAWRQDPLPLGTQTPGAHSAGPPLAPSPGGVSESGLHKSSIIFVSLGCRTPHEGLPGALSTRSSPALSAVIGGSVGSHGLSVVESKPVENREPPAALPHRATSSAVAGPGCVPSGEGGPMAPAPAALPPATTDLAAPQGVWFHGENTLFLFVFNNPQQGAGLLGTVPLAGAGGGWRGTQRRSPGHWPDASRHPPPASPHRSLRCPVRGGTGRPSPCQRGVPCAPQPMGPAGRALGRWCANGAGPARPGDPGRPWARGSSLRGGSWRCGSAALALSPGRLPSH